LLRVAFFSPMPPSKSGIADYSEALVAQMSTRTHVDVFTDAADPSQHDVALYHIGNNPFHAFAYETALKHPGVVVMHEANLHHLVADITIKRGDWDSYLAEAELNGGAAALAYAKRARTLVIGPDYDNVPMTRRLLDASRGLVVHSDFVARAMREQGFQGPIATIPHGAWIPKTDRNATRHTLGLDDSTPLIGAFGYLKPYKRIAESLRALRRLVRIDPRVRMILVGEPHPEFPVQQLIRTLGLEEHVRVLGFTPIEKFVDYIGACDIVLNLRYPTVGETSGSLTRSLGLGKAVIVSDVGSFSELPDDICLKVPVNPQNVQEEEDFIFEYLNLLVTRPDLARAMGERARCWVERECNWATVANRYVEFLGSVRNGGMEDFPRTQVRFAAVPAVAEQEEEEVAEPEPARSEALSVEIETSTVEEEDAVSDWIAPEARVYAKQHQSRFAKTLEMVPPGDETKSILEMGAYMQITPALHFNLGYGYVRGCYYGKPGRIDQKRVESETGEVFECEIDHFDAERNCFPYADESFDTVLCCELIEHLFGDPMHMMSEINRILKPDGHLLMTTPNLGSLRAISAILTGYHPAFFPAYIRPRNKDEEVDARHNREYVPMEIEHLFCDAGFAVERLETGEFLDEPHPEYGWVNHLLGRYLLHTHLRGDGIYALGRKTGPVKDRWPSWLYA
jgi:glycosyltransferase involved in cell wall biosynthesis/SAM-dependent methyltransferase